MTSAMGVGGLTFHLKECSILRSMAQMSSEENCPLESSTKLKSLSFFRFRRERLESDVSESELVLADPKLSSDP